MLGNYQVAAQLLASRVVLSSMELVRCRYICRLAQRYNLDQASTYNGCICLMLNYRRFHFALTRRM
jgi:hypothetical protein